MCDPVTIGLGVVAAGTSLYGASKQASAQKKASQAIADQNVATSAAQNEGFAGRLEATKAQTAAQTAAQKATLGNETQIADAMRGGQRSALQRQQDTLSALNEQEGGLRDVGYQSANDLMDATSGANLGQAQTDWNTQAASLLDSANVGALSGADAPGGTGSDPYTQAALRRRAAEAATNIRAYGSKAAQVGSYAAPLQRVQNAVQDSQTGIMPAQVASKLLQGSTPILMQPAETAWGNAGRYGEAAMTAANQSGQAAQNIAGMQYQNSTDLANLQQSDKTTVAANIAEQAKADAAFQAAMGGVISGIGNLGLQGVGYYGKLPGFMNKLPGAPLPIV